MSIGEGHTFTTLAHFLPNVIVINGGEVTSLDENLTLKFKANTVPEDLKLTITKKDSTHYNNLSGHKRLSDIYAIEAVDQDGNQISNITQPGKYATIILKYVPNSNIKENTESIYYYFSNAWKNDDITNIFVNTQNSTISGDINHLTDFTVFGENASLISLPDLLPTTGSKMLLLLLGIALPIIIIFIFRKRRNYRKANVWSV